MHNIGNVTHNGNIEAETLCRQALEDACKVITLAVPETELEALLLIGGYGRGEGGVVKVAGHYLPHNNLDLLLVQRGGRKQAVNNKQCIDKLLETIRRQYGIGIDISVFDVQHFIHQQCRVMWYDMKGGHKVLLGNTRLASSLAQHTLANIPAWDVRNLLINRGSLLLVNRIILAWPLTEKRRKTVIRHFIKAIIGYGDALLYFSGNYHWSYKAKARLMANSTAISANIKTLYDFAIRFRFSPDYAHFDTINLEAYNEQLINTLAPAHLACEQARLHNNKLNWQNYLGYASSKSLGEGLPAIMPLARRLYRKLTQKKCLIDKMAQPASMRLLPAADKLPLVFPFILYNIADGQNPLFTASRQQRLAVCKQYLLDWQQYIDSNLRHHLAALDITLEQTLEQTA